MSDSLRPVGLQHARPSCPLPTLSLLKLMSIESVMSSNHLILCPPLLLLPPIFLSIRVFSNESALCITWPKYWSFSFNISPSNEHPGLISFRMDWLDLLGVQGTLKSLLQHHSSKASILWCSAFFTVQLSHPYMTTRKTVVLSSLDLFPWRGQKVLGPYFLIPIVRWRWEVRELTLNGKLCCITKLRRDCVYLCLHNWVIDDIIFNSCTLVLTFN